MDRFQFAYDLHEAGWATARILHGSNSVDMAVSYLHDSLRELATAAHSISRGSGTSRVVFMDEPGEHQLTITRENQSNCSYSIRWFDDWDSWDMRSSSGPKDLFDGTVSVRRFVQQVYTALWTIHEKYGESGYKDRWGEHEFPFNEMQRLVGITNPSSDGRGEFQ